MEKTKPQTTPAAAQTDPGPDERWELAAQWQLLWRSVKWTVTGAIFFFGLLAVGQVYLFHQLFADIHPFLGGAFIGVITGLFIWLIGLPLSRFLNSPAIAHPPDVDLNAKDIDDDSIRKRISFDKSYLKTMAANPELAGDREAIDRTYTDLESLANDLGNDGAARLHVFERERIAPLLAALDKRIDDYIHKEALSVGSATAISMNGSIDAFIVLWRNINMIARISRLYYGRPSLRLSLMILRDVMVAVLLSRALDDVTDAAGEALGRIVSRLGGAIIGPLMDGSVNALMTLKIGYLAKRRCRSFDVWSKASATRATAEAFERVKKEAAGITGELVKTSSGFASATARAAGNVAGVASDAAGKVIAAPKSAWSLVQGAFVRKPSAR